jgi:protein-L-isoaspartate O-methyltransferase
MATVSEHYDKVLSDVYSWMFGGFEIAIQRNAEFIIKHNLRPEGSGIVIDLGSGCGFQSIPLAKAGYSVTAIDIDAKLLNELKEIKNNMKHNGIIAIVHQPRKPGATEQDSTEAGDQFSKYLEKAQFKNIRIEKKMMKPVSTLCVLGANS